MKKIILVLPLFLISFSIYSQSGWIWQNPYPQGNDLNDISFINAQTGWFAGNLGTIVKTTDGGNTFSSSQVSLDYTFTNVKFLNDLTGYIAGRPYSPYGLFLYGFALLKTTNGGNNWTIISSSANDIFRKIVFNNQNTGWFLKTTSTSSKLFKTTNGGVNWDSTLFNGSQFSTLFFLDDFNGWMGENSLILKTSDGGNSWNQISINFQPNTLFFVNSSTGFSSGGNTGIYKTTNNGLNWINLNLGNFNFITHCTDISFTDVNNGIFVGRFRDRKVTNNSGLDLQTQEFDSVYSLNNLVDFGNVFNRVININGTGYIAGNFGEIRRQVSTTWQNVTQFTKTDFNQIQFLNNTTGYVTGGGLFNRENAVLKTTNAGNNWIKAFNNPDTNCSSSYFVNENTGWIGGITLYKTINGGQNWQLELLGHFSGEVSGYSQPYFRNVYTGYAVSFTGGERGYLASVLIKTTNSGAQWDSTSLTGRYFKRLKFINDNTAWVIRNAGTNTNSLDGIVRTTDGGSTWNVLPRPQGYYPLNDIDLINENLGWCCVSDRIASTTNSGLNWETILSDDDFKFVKFFNVNTGIVLSKTKIYRTFDGGSSWTMALLSYNAYIHDMNFINENTGWVSGSNGTILKTTNSGGIIGMVPFSNYLPKNFLLHQNYPNPFNPTTSIKFDIPKSGIVSLKIYDMLGKQIYSLNEYKPAGQYEFTFDASNYASGLYFYKMESGTFTETKKMILIK